MSSSVPDAAEVARRAAETARKQKFAADWIAAVVARKSAEGGWCDATVTYQFKDGYLHCVLLVEETTLADAEQPPPAADKDCKPDQVS